jgi:glycine/D-amino acid oxidase-like deaminating enzyme
MKSLVIGGGVVGTSIAWHLAKRGTGQVVLLERERLGSGSTWHSAGNITWKPLPDHDAAVLYAYDTLAELQRITGLATGWVRTGRMFMAQSRETRAAFESFDAVARERGIEARWIGPEEAKRLNPLLEPSGIDGIWFLPLSGRANPADLTAAYASAARKAGAEIREGVRVEALERRGDRTIGVRTSMGPIAADEVVVAAGLWSRQLLASADVELAQWPCRHFYLIVETPLRLARETPSFVAPDLLLYGREEVGGFLVGCFDENAIPIEPSSLPEPFSFSLLPPDWDKIAPYFEKAERLFPSLATAPVRSFINGPETFTPDGLPLIGRVGGCAGLSVATAMNSTGVTWSAMAGAIIGDILAGMQPRFDHRRYDPDRFGARAGDPEFLRDAASQIVSKGYRNAKQL